MYTWHFTGTPYNRCCFLLNLSEGVGTHDIGWCCCRSLVQRAVKDGSCLSQKRSAICHPLKGTRSSVIVSVFKYRRISGHRWEIRPCRRMRSTRYWYSTSCTLGLLTNGVQYWCASKYFIAIVFLRYLVFKYHILPHRQSNKDTSNLKHPIKLKRYGHVCNIWELES